MESSHSGYTIGFDRYIIPPERSGFGGVLNWLQCFVKAVFAGMMISIGGIVFLSSDYKIVGAVLFAVGLFAVLSYDFYLYTGRVCYTFDNDKTYALSVVVTILGNFVGSFIMGMFFPLPAATAVCQAKLALDFVPVLAKGFACGILMFLAVDTYREKKSFVGTFICVPAFIMAGFEHSIADMFYFSSAGIFTAGSLTFILLALAGNFVGCTIFPLFRKLTASKPSASE